MWYCYINDRQYGPVDEQVLRDWISEGRLRPTDYVWTAGMADWKEAGTVPSLLGAGTTESLAAAPAAGGTGGRTPNAELMAQARSLLSGRWGLPIGFSLLLWLLGMAAGMVPYIGGIAQLILTGPLQLGGVIFYLTFARGGAAELGMMFAGFKAFGTALGAYLLMALLILGWALLAALPGIALVIALAAGEALKPEAALSLSILIFLPAIVVIIIKSLAYSQTLYLISDNRTIGPLNAIRKSKEMMRGYKWKLFCLGLRSIGWWLLCVLTLGIGFLWLVPYMAVSYARFYDDLRSAETAAPPQIQIEPVAPNGV